VNRWKGIVGRGFRPEEFQSYVDSLRFAYWRPQFTVVHNTSAPRLSQWHCTLGATRMRNLEDYYRKVRGWSAGPHLFIADNLIWVFTPLTTARIHSPFWNAISWGVEMVGEYEEELFDAAVLENTVAAVTTLYASPTGSLRRSQANTSQVTIIWILAQESCPIGLGTDFVRWIGDGHKS
jgi:N-acetylmuramoyl-L-alanine amidase